ncbi:MAG: response regulator [Treponema sp.]|jgi:DNA-binding response OmpR family regulator|nr:response regulator [Treponema sp.]
MLEIKKRTILAIDDDLTSLITLRTILEGSFDVCLAKSTDIAMTILNTTEIDMILLDMEMPGISGLDFLTLLQNNPSFYHIPVIVVSSHGKAEVIIQAQKAGAKDFAVKPAAPKVLLEKIYAIFKTAPAKITRDVLLRKLNLLDSACKQGKTARVEDLSNELMEAHYSLSVDTEIAEISKCAAKLEYNLVIEKIDKLLHSIR